MRAWGNSRANPCRVKSRTGTWTCGGRPPALSAKDLQVAKAMLKDPDITVAAVAQRLNVAASTLYRHIPHARSATLEE
ncbi:helix-turn-helix domain-containing protein [Nitrosospira multiformis]|uniref:helix-turn-helix domain-containing protein n=1 Tax=Nitrosospira multiformis TaxID=1231 RepID=UPI0011B20088